MSRTLTVSAIGALAVAFWLATVIGHASLGVRCTRSPGKTECEFPNTGHVRSYVDSGNFVVPESVVLDARLGPLPAEAGGTIYVYLHLMLDPDEDYPVLVYQSVDQAVTAAKTINAYLADKSIPSLVFRDDVTWVLLMEFLAPFVFCAATLVLSAWRFLGRRPSA